MRIPAIATATTTVASVLLSALQCQSVTLTRYSALRTAEEFTHGLPSSDYSSGLGRVEPELVESRLVDGDRDRDRESDAFRGYELVPAQFVGSVLGEEVRLNGTVQEVMAQLQEKYNGADSFDEDFAGAGGGRPPGDLSSLRGGWLDEVGKRNKKFPATCIPILGTDWKFAMGPATDDNVRLLERIGGRVVLGAHQCIRLACSGSSAIFLCNDNTFKIEPRIVYISTYASDLRHQCIARVNNPKMDLCGGVLTDTDRYEVIVRNDKC